MKKILILGAGMVARPMVEYLLGCRYSITIASPMKERADEMIGGNPLGSSLYWTMEEPAGLEKLIPEHDLAVSLLPYRFHPDVARVCLRFAKPLVTTSYVQPAMQALDSVAAKAGIILLNEIGLDPGIDHMSAMKLIDHVHSTGGRVEAFWSMCGALPAPEAANNPFGYKFSWSPAGVILASMNSALYQKNGIEVHIDPVNLFRDRFSYEIPGLGEFEVYPNRDSISYREIYGIPEVKTIYRGTFRYKGWCEAIDAIKRLKLLDCGSHDYSGMTLSGVLAELCGEENSDLPAKVASKLGCGEDSQAIRALEFLGFFSDQPAGVGQSTPFDITSGRMFESMMLRENERDMVVLRHVLLAAGPSGRKEVIRSSMIDFGMPSGNTSIARTVSLPAAIAVKLILEGRITITGVQRPVIPEIYLPVLDELGRLGIEMNEEYGLPESEIVF